MKQIPNLFTLLNLLFGCLAIIFTLENGIVVESGADGIQYLMLSEKIWFASLFIGLAALVDFLDGFVARMFRASSAMGKQLDSLADLVSFGVAPGIILYQMLRFSFAKGEDGINTSILFLVPAFLIPCAAAWRLAKFNLDPGQEYGFKGVPTPAIGLLVASLPLIYMETNVSWLIDLLRNQWMLYAVIAFLSFLMVSSLPMMSLKFKNFGLKDNWPKYFLVILAIGGFLVLKWLVIPLVFIAYVLVSLLLKNKTA